jgi:uncharacterized protein YbcC (UPF0753/DUF2309 family)
MSIARKHSHQTLSTPLEHQPGHYPSLTASALQDIRSVLEQVQGKISPVWPLKDYVAVNPYEGFSTQPFLDARCSVRSVSDLETLMSLDYYREQFADGLIKKADIDDAIDELVADGVTGAEGIDINQVVTLLREASPQGPSSDAEFTRWKNPNRVLRTYAEIADEQADRAWSQLITEEVCKHCANHYDDGQAVWTSPDKQLPLYQAWRSTAQHDRTFEIHGVKGFRKFIASLPDDPHAALNLMLSQLGVPAEIWEDFLLCNALMSPGWSAWTQYQKREALRNGNEDTDFAGLMAMRLAYEVAVSKHLNFQVDWNAIAKSHFSRDRHTESPKDEDLLRYALLRASEIAFRNQLLSDLDQAQMESKDASEIERRLAQLVFCIDVRSERIRRNLESITADVDTFGFAGFFGLPIEFVSLGEANGSPQVPALISPHFKVHEDFDAGNASRSAVAIKKRTTIRFFRKAWKELQTSALSCFAFVETTGLFYGFKLLSRSLGFGKPSQSRFDGVANSDHQCLAPTLKGLEKQGVTMSQQTDMAESMLRGIGIVKDFARLVVLCGHGSQTENNPLQAGLDCGACGGHSGEANARFGAKLLNQPSIRQALVDRGIEIPADTHFVAALHNTTTDNLIFFDTHELPASHESDLAELRKLAATASEQTRSERLAILPGNSTSDLLRRSQDWSEIRPEWGLAGNAAFIVAPRKLTADFSLEGRSFLHSYDYRNDPDFAVLEQIMTAPMVVAHWINMQYYASTVDPIHFGSGNKAVHNVVGRFGVLSGNSGDLMTGLPWQSVHDGDKYQHHPLRLLAVIAAPRQAIESVIAKHEMIKHLLVNGWLQLIAIEDGVQYRYTEQQTWSGLPIDDPTSAADQNQSSQI